jgi:DNA-binding GntR family transcriptional regulator
MNDLDENLMPAIERSETLAEQAYSRLKSALATGAFKPGETLSIRRLAGLLGVSATPARDAIARSLWDGSLESRPNRTVAVPTLTVKNLDEIYTVRINLEGLATELAAPNFNRSKLVKLETIHATYSSSLDAEDYSKALQENESFHFLIYEQSNNAVLVDIIKSLWLKMGPSLNLLFPAYSDRRGMNHKLKILSALRKQSGSEARAAMEADLIDGKAEIKRALTMSEAAGKPARKRSARI